MRGWQLVLECEWQLVFECEWGLVLECVGGSWCLNASGSLSQIVRGG